MLKLNAKQLRKTPPRKGELKTIKRNPIYLVADNVIDTYNIGSLFRLADAVACEKLYLGGDCEYPPSAKIHKAAVGTEEWVPWQKTDSVLKLISKLKTEGIQIIAVEQNPQAINYKLLAKSLRFPCAIIVGHETAGVSPEVIKLADIVVELPMFGVNKSFNVWGSAAVICFKVLESLPMLP
jgi:tRNA G18 (ribose-2'-O)-methylase SpoU